MQGYSYSTFSLVAIALHLIINFNLITGRWGITTHGTRYRGVLLGILAYFVADGAWGLFAGLGWTRALYVDSIFFFLSLVAFALLWSWFLVAYLEIAGWPARVIAWSGWALVAFNLAALAANPFTGCVFSIGADGVYRTGWARNPAFYLLVAFMVMLALFVYAKALVSREAVRRRSMMVAMFCILQAASNFLQVIWPLTPFTALGSLVGFCFLQVFLVADDQTARHMAELEKALVRARAAEKARSMFFSIVSHDIRTPLNAILGYTELLQVGIWNQAERDAALESIRASGTTLLELVNDVLDLARIDAGKMTLQPGPVRLEKLVGEVFASFRLTAEGKGVALVNRTAGVPELLLDEHRFRQILFNLVGNAVKFTTSGSVTVSAVRNGTTLEVAVADTGCGIPREMQGSILDAFVQVQEPTHSADRAGGSGLGLSICRRLVEMMGGELLVQSEPGKGSTFTARIPGVAVPGGREEHAAAEKAPAVPSNRPNHVLVVDDSPVNRSVLTAFLKRAGVPAIEQACDGAEALAKLEAADAAGHPHDFVFSDFWMPNMSGAEFIEKLRATPHLAHLPVYALTADTEYRRDSRSALFTGILLKPLTYAKLVAVFSSIPGQ
ncbi:MAG: response regulator [Kiritimatiellae bacterium]|nr:response regulator [Kiritimatiellia bacterium]